MVNNKQAAAVIKRTNGLWIPYVEAVNKTPKQATLKLSKGKKK